MASIAAAAGARAAAARHVASAAGVFGTLFPRRGFAAGTALPAARTRPLPSHTAAATRLLRRGLATIPDDYHYHGSMNHVPLCWVDPEAPGNRPDRTSAISAALFSSSFRTASSRNHGCSLQLLPLRVDQLLIIPVVG